MKITFTKLQVPNPVVFPIEGVRKITASFGIYIDFELKDGETIDPRHYGEILHSMQEIRDAIAAVHESE